MQNACTCARACLSVHYYQVRGLTRTKHFTMATTSGSRDIAWLRGLTGVASLAAWTYSCGCLAYCVYLLLRIELAILPSIGIIDVQAALTMITGMAGTCGAITLKKEPLLLHCCLTTFECLGYLSAGTFALHNRVTVGSRLEISLNELLNNFVASTGSDEDALKLYSLQTVLRCCGKNGGQDFQAMEKPHVCVRGTVAHHGCLRAALNLLASEIFHQSCVGFAGAFLLLFSLFSAASLMSYLRNCQQNEE
uniref:ABC transmembrane type-1 domain-containing protein n=1 Tax=Mesocestoides corti TaxID=53468 RepID=A0A5K3EKD2_MESCO